MTTQDIAIRLVLAIIFAGVIGYDRQRKSRPAGLRTHILVCVGATTVALIQSAVFYEKLSIHPEIDVDQVRLLAPIVSGIGFLGAGTIVVTKQRVAGLTTAASLWTSAGIGIALGMGYYKIACLSFLAVVFSLTIIRFIVHVPNVKRLEVQFVHRLETKAFLNEYFSKYSIELNDVLFDVQNVDGRNVYRNIFTIHLPKDISLVNIVEDLSLHKDIMKIRLVSIVE
ncbi:MgtC/SapB family protein [Granulicatella sp. zg-ZJ]|uniref:MgtC/SapB family protein n=1 Tax=unclassified Granulicatella TaxID=2630493 RepID=UPI0013C06417|nr:MULTISPECIES: MgtC/SapB family protein [unclassified Granulicatella]MBS4751030.1 MgtC/SapB family protein [Carnobacteriaceae bacterium zg-ZUI78]NEW62842.1 MgtC/SapB family protein [Granulicatella sp. zg-ZJ]NEW65466.1 MgtC/SapB family protein [Granulicatella sp. zg-84]QMI85260.1 MgtC/SapB family protein [Carnobacteriaceae bacterium zg-84]